MVKGVATFLMSLLNYDTRINCLPWSFRSIHELPDLYSSNSITGFITCIQVGELLYIKRKGGGGGGGF